MRNGPPAIQTMSACPASRERLVEGLTLTIADLYRSLPHFSVSNPALILRTPLNAACDTLLQFLQYLINGEARCLLARGEILERRQEPAHDMLRRHKKENMVEHPIPVGVRGDVCKFERVCAQIGDLRNSQFHERLRP